jgi:hypothetical protein
LRTASRPKICWGKYTKHFVYCCGALTESKELFQTFEPKRVIRLQKTDNIDKENFTIHYP